MRSPLLNAIRGFVKVEIRGKRPEQFINEAMAKRIIVWDARKTAEERIELYLQLPDYFRLRPLLKQTSCKVHVLSRHGLPFMLDKLERRKFFAAGIVLFILVMLSLSQVVWKVEVEGNDNLDSDLVLKAADKQGIHRLQWKFRLDDPANIGKALMNDLPGTSWIGVDIRGTRIVIQVVESTEPQKRTLQNPRHLVSDSDAIVSHILVNKGRALVKPNTRVKKGDILISGYVGSEQNSTIVVAEGVVKGIVWREYEIVVPLVHNYKAYTGRTKTKLYLVGGNRALQITGYREPHFDRFEAIPDRKTLQWRNFAIPIGWMKEKVMETEYVERNRTLEEAKAVGLQQAIADIIIRAGKDAMVKGEKILQVKDESGKVYMKVLFEVEENIAKELPIIQGE